MDAFKILFVCEGNVCRSPAAELLVRAAALPGVEVSSAGLGAPAGHPISAEIAHLLSADGIASADHRATPLSRVHLRCSDLVLTMTVEQRSEVVSREPELLRRAFTLAEMATLARLPEVSPVAAGTSDEYREWVRRAARARSRVRGVDKDIPDPWRGELEGYRNSYAMVKDACRTLAGAMRFEPAEHSVGAGLAAGEVHPMKVLLTGAHGFLGWHTRCLLLGSPHEVVAVSRDNWNRLPELAAKCDAVIHVAGVNRGAPEDVALGNQRLARELTEALDAAGISPRIIYAGSTQQALDNPYGQGKREAAQWLREWCSDNGTEFVEVLLTNLFGEHGRPDYNSFVATFVDRVVSGAEPTISDREVELLHAQDAAAALLDGLQGAARQELPSGVVTSVAAVWGRLVQLHACYAANGDIPALGSHFDVQLFNQLRVRMFQEIGAFSLAPRSDDRGRLVETVRCHGGEGQTFLSTTHPGVTRGEHFHRRKVERFVVLAGSARIELRRLFHDDVVTFHVTGEEPVAIDMPTMWAHNITNTGSDEVHTLFWTNELFDPADPDTIPEAVRATEEN